MNMGSCRIFDLAKVICKGKIFDYTIIGEKPGEKLYEELVTEVEAPRTALKNNIYTVIPETIFMMAPSIGKAYNETYKDIARLKDSLRSDNELISELEIESYLTANQVV